MVEFLKNFLRLYRYRKIIDTLEIQNNSTILDLSCSDGEFLKQISLIAPGLKLFGIDNNSIEIKKAKINFPLANYKNESAEKLDFQDTSFDFIFSIMSLHHYKDLQKILIEVERILKTNGVLYIADLIPKYKFTQKIWNWHGCSQPYHFEKYYSIRDLEIVLKTQEFKIVSEKIISIIPRLRILKINKKEF